MTKTYDIAIIGGGINGCGIAREAAARGFSVVLAEQNDLASGTSSASTKLIHGGLRYLEHYEFRLVREALQEREVLLAIAPHIIWPLRFVLPHSSDLRPAWLLRTGLFLYDHLGGRKLLPKTKTLDLKHDVTGKPLKPGFSRGFEYSDCWVDDARLVTLNARDAAERGASIRTRTKVTGLARDQHWTIDLLDQVTGKIKSIQARIVVNAAGPWIDDVLNMQADHDDVHNVRLVQGSHIVVKKKFEHDRAYIFQNGDGRIVFAIPYEDDFTLIGTTDSDYRADPANAKISQEETRYLCAAVSDYFSQPVHEEDVVWSYSGVRPLYDDGATKAQEATRDYVLKSDDTNGLSLVNIFGGKITTYRRLALSAMELIETRIGKRGAALPAGTPLPGGDFAVGGLGGLVARHHAAYPFLEEAHMHRLTRLYGTQVTALLGRAAKKEDLGQHFGADLYEAEVRYLMKREWARHAEDILWRRTKLGLRIAQPDKETLEKFMMQATEETV
ncbi:glycerol-3-phosphate dehydrogenase [Limoniibacter endophyticus]|uniref:Glycerol-3-phosphate dehydrogenase n=1 Tax=Limoniibacter endophyticus TaxID=1565040 RepID=A0A8J3GFW4_9HYPH|nr:glycerol-3-phosphate dehydrogenase [Limoniibacter endophyticus]GHC61228.1 glycerol-3-phosphate dehydrogenase [Limoniibacter endophyticus]